MGFWLTLTIIILRSNAHLGGLPSTLHLGGHSIPPGLHFLLAMAVVWTKIVLDDSFLLGRSPLYLPNVHKNETKDPSFFTFLWHEVLKPSKAGKKYNESLWNLVIMLSNIFLNCPFPASIRWCWELLDIGFVSFVISLIAPFEIRKIVMGKSVPSNTSETNYNTMLALYCYVHLQ